MTDSFPPQLQELGKQSWLAAVQRSAHLSKFQEEVSRVLWRMGVLHRNAHILQDGMFCVDIALEGDKVCLVYRP